MFKAKDESGDGHIQRSELEGLLSALGYRDLSTDDVSEKLSQIDLDSDGTVSFTEFLNFMAKV